MEELKDFKKVEDSQEINDIEDIEEIEEISDVEELSEEDSLLIDPKHKLYIPKLCLDAGQVVNILRRMLKSINHSYIEIAEVTSFFAIKIFDYAKLNNKIDSSIERNELILLSLLFTIGAYREELKNFADENDSQLKKDADIFLYSFLYLKNMSPLKEVAESILLFNYNYQDAKKLDNVNSEYASLIFTCMRIFKQFKKNKFKVDENFLSEEFINKCKKLYNPVYIDLFLEANKDEQIINKIQNKSYIKLVDNYCSGLVYNYEDTFKLLKMMIYSVDFVSTSTVTHIINTAFHATELCKLLKLTYSDTDEVFTAALIHDMGKLAVDVKILESSERLTDEQMNQMRQHVFYGQEMCKDFVGQKVLDIAFRHHELLDGSGYLNHLSADDLSFQQKVMTVSDIFSALTDVRTYKESYPKDKTISILQGMAKDNKIESSVVQKVEENYDKIISDTKIRRPMLTVNLGSVMVEYMMIKDYKTVPELFEAIREPIL